MFVIAVVLTGAVAVVILLPMFESTPQPVRSGPRGSARQNQAWERLTDEKFRVLRAIRDLDFDYDLGKLTDDAYATQRVYLLRLGVAIMQRLDELEAVIAEQNDQIEAAVAAYRNGHQRDGKPVRVRSKRTKQKA